MEPTRFRPRPTLYKGIRMRSRLEASVAGFLDREGVRWTYEPIAFADESGQYLPDFRVDGLLAMPLYVDVKGHQPSEDEMTDLFERMKVIWSSEPRVLLAVWTADLFGIEGRFDVMFPDGWRRPARVGRCGPCGGITFRATCQFCGRMVEPVSPLMAA